MKTFEDLVAGRVPAHRVWEDERHLAFLNPRPIRPGHVIVLPKEHCAYVFDLGEAEHRALWDAVRTVARAIEASLGCERVCLAVVGWEVRHVHVHLVPTERPGEFPPLPGDEASEDELAAMRERIAAGFTGA
jgi:histidine triad (HIT) family protein